jgi:hypothetical protein
MMNAKRHFMISDLTGKKALAVADAVIGEVRDAYAYAYAFVPLTDGRRDLS